MNLDAAQRNKVTEWIAQGLKLSEIQSRLSSEFDLRLTYMDVRILVDDLKLVPKDVEPAKPVDSVLTGAGAPPAGKPAAPGKQPAPAPAPGGVSVTVDQLARPGALVSGKVTFGDGKTAEWYLDQAGRLGLAPQEKGYRPSNSDLQQVQAALENELSKMGL